MSSSSDSGYWDEIDRINTKYREMSQHEERYIYESAIDIKNSVYKIVTGFSSARGYVPAVRILLNIHQTFTKPENISFIKEDWNDFITHLQRCITHYFNEDDDDDDDDTTAAAAIEFKGKEEEEEEEIKFSEYSIIKTPFIGNKALKVTNGFSTFYFSGNTVRQLIEMNKLVYSHMDLLHNLNLNHFYNNFLNVTNNILSESSYELPPCTIMLNLCDLYPHNILSHCMRECLTYYRNSVLNDLDRKMFNLK